MFPNFFAPAITQSLASLLMILKMTGAGVDLCWNTRAFLSFEMVQPTSMVRDAMAFLLGMLLPDMFLHQCESECKVPQVAVSIT